MKRWSIELEEATLWIAVLRSALSWSELLGSPNCVQEMLMYAMLAVHMLSKLTHALISGQPAATVPVPV